ncbi:DMT family transporter [Microbacterium sp. NPDC089695]|uniref:DMT family transporter n=1 Tax=Microbacterium sp. NPDC089695 TaxID=3364198 RepID=UPI0037F5CAD4
MTESERVAPGSSWVTVQFVLVGVVWGSSFLFMKVGLEAVSPGQLVWARLVLGALTLGVVMLVRRERLPRAIRLWGHLLVIALTFCVAPFLLFAWAQQYVSSGLGSIYNATTPIMAAVMAGAVFRVEKLRAGQLAGVALGIVGVIVIVAPWQGLDLQQSVPAQMAMLAATACYGFSFAYMRKFVSNSGVSPLVFSFMNIGLAAAVMILLTPLLAVEPISLAAGPILAILALGALGTGVAYIWNQTTVRAWGPTRASTVTYLTPMVGVALGVLILHESVSWNEPVGGLVVILGILLAQDRIRTRRRGVDRLVE